MYQLTKSTGVIRLADGACISADATQSNWQAYLNWVAQGGIPAPYVEPTAPVPTALTMRQARLALLGVNLLDAVTTSINSLPEPARSKAQIEWEYSNEVQRHNGFVAQLAPALNLSETQLDALFVAGAKL